MSIRLYHITSPERAIAILEQEIFYPVSNHEKNNDNGLNCFSFGEQGYRLGQYFDGVGAKLILEWTGEITTTPVDADPPLTPNILHKQYPWRCFLRAGTDNKKLRIVGIRFINDINDLLEVPLLYNLLPIRFRNKLVRKKRLYFLREIRRKYKLKPYLIVSASKYL